MNRTVNDKILEKFFYWISERHQVYLKKEINFEPKPWTDDEILRGYRFANVFRDLDRGTQWVKRNFIKPHYNDGAFLFFNLLWYRSFNWIGTGETLGYLNDWDSDKVSQHLKEIKNDGGKVFTSSHNIATHGWKEKIDRVVYGIIEPIWKDLGNIYSNMPNSIKKATHYLQTFHGFGGSGFMAYEVITDLTFTPKLEDAFDKKIWVNFSPMALDGLISLFGKINRTGKKSEADKLELSHMLLEEVNIHFTGSHVPQLELRDLVHTLGQFNKYLRTSNGEGRPKERYNGYPNFKPMGVV